MTLAVVCSRANRIKPGPPICSASRLNPALKSLGLSPTKRSRQLQYPFGTSIPALRQKFTGVHIALYSHLVAALLKSEEPTLGHIGRAVIAAQASDIDKMSASPPGLDMRPTTKTVVRMGMRMPTQPQIDRPRMGVQVVLENA